MNLYKKQTKKWTTKEVGIGKASKQLQNKIDVLDAKEALHHGLQRIEI